MLWDFLEKPISTEKLLLLTVENAVRLVRLEQENRDLKHRLGRHQIVWASPAMREVMAQVEQVEAASETRVCILRRNGHGQGIDSRCTLHEKSPRHGAPFISAELCRDSRRADGNGAVWTREGFVYRSCRTGTLENSSKRITERFSSTKSATCPSPCRPSYSASSKKAKSSGLAVAARLRWTCAWSSRRTATSRSKSGEGTFREDLYHRVFVFPIVLPLRERREDIRVLAEHFSKQLAEQNHWKPKSFSPETLTALENYAWPGNVRELRNVIERVLLYATGDVIEAATIARALPQGATLGAGLASDEFGAGTLAGRVESFERETLLAELKRNRHHMTNTAKALGLERSHLYKKCQQLGIDLRCSIRQTD